MDPATISAAVNDLYRRHPHLPPRDDLAQIIEAAYHHPTHRPGRMPGVVAALWPIGAAAGAARGHTLMITALRDEVARTLADPTLPTAARWVVMTFAQATHLPPTPDPQRDYTVADVWRLGGDPRGLDDALVVGLAHGWRAGHSDATEHVITAFADRVVALLGPDRLTRPLAASLTGDDLLDAITFAAGATAAADRDHPTPLAARSTPPADRSVAGRAFARLRSVDPPPPRTRPVAAYRPQTGPGRRGPGR